MNIDNLNIKISDNSQQAASNIDKLAASLASLKAKVSGMSGMKTLSSNLEKVTSALSGLNNVNTAKMQQIANSINILTSVEKGNLNSVINSMKKIPEAFSGLDSVDADKIKSLTDSLKPLETLEKTNLGNMLNQLKKFPDVMKSFGDIPNDDLERFAQKIERVTQTLRPLADEMAKVSAGFSAFPYKLQKAMQLGEATASKNAFSGFAGMNISLNAIISNIKRLGSVMGSWIDKSSQYVESINLFSVAMGDAADSALAFAEAAGEALSIDPAAFMEAQGVFQQIITAFGTGNEQAAGMSRTLTQLGYDIASFYNISEDAAFEKLQSGITGQVTPLRQLGISVDQVTLKEYAMKLGIEQKISTMSQAEKATLRYIAILDQTSNAHNDMARTIDSPANMMRVLQAQVEQLQRALGNILIPALTSVLPYVIALVKGFRLLADAIAKVFGFEVPEFDYGGLTGASSVVTDLADSAELASSGISGIGKAAKKAGQQIRKDLLLTFDELNVMNEGQITAAAGGGGGGGASLGNMFGDWDLPSYEWQLDGLDDKVNEIMESFKRWLPVIKTVGAALLLVFGLNTIGKYVKNALALKKSLDGASGLTSAFMKVKAGVLGFVATFAVGMATFYGATLKVAEGGNAWAEYGKALGVTVIAVGAVGLALQAVLGPVGWAVAALGGLAGAIAGAYSAHHQLLVELGQSILFDETGIKITDLANNFTTLFDSVTESRQGIIDAGVEISNMKQSVVDTATQVSTLVFAVKNGAISIDEAMPQITEAFNKMKTDTKTILDEVYMNIIGALAGSVGTALEEMGFDLGEITQAVKGAKDTLVGDLDSLWGEYLDTANKLKEGKGDRVALEEQLESLGLEIAGLTAKSKPELSNFRSTVYDSFTGIDLESPEAIKDAMENITNSSGLAKDALAQSAQVMIEDLNLLKKGAAPEDVEIFDELLQGIIIDRDKNIAEIDGAVQVFADSLTNEFGAATEEIALAAQEKWQNMNFFQRWLTGNGNEADYVNSAITAYQKDTIDPLIEEIKGINGTVGERISEGSDNIFQVVFDNLFTTGNGMITGYKNDIKGTFADISKAIPEGVADGINSNSNPYVKAALEMAEATGKEFKLGIKSNSPSKLFSEISKSIPEGTGKGITDNIKIVTKALETMVQDMQKSYENKTKVFDTSTKTMMTSIANVIRSEQNNVNKPFTDIFQNLNNVIKTVDLSGSVKAVIKDISNVFASDNSIANSFGSMMNKTLSKMETFAGRMKNAVNEMLKNWSKAMNSVNINSSTGNMTYSNMASLSIPKFASGGFPVPGQLFMAREYGLPEMVGTMGGRTAVANNDQIVEGISAGVYNAVVAAMSQSGGSDGNITVHVTLDGEQVYKNQQKVSARKGADVGMGSFRDAY